MDGKADIDYHFYRQDKKGLWSHKAGRTEATDIDAKGKKITNPLVADRDYGRLNYSTPCFFFCVNTSAASISSTRQSRSKLNIFNY